MFGVIFKNISVPCGPFSHCLRFCHAKVRVRFAPSPTGFLHLGGLRTALYNYLFAKKAGGSFILRIEDTDQARLIKGSMGQLYEDLLWSGIEIDESTFKPGSCGPYLQSKRLEIYREQVKHLIDNETAYYCFCTERRLELLRKEALRTRAIPKYDNRCRHLTKREIRKKLENGEQYCVRFKLEPGALGFNDLIYGYISYDISLNEGDPVIIKSDGYPTYHFANVVDDHLMKISHVLRGAEWQISTTKHLLLYKAFNWTPPEFGHLPLLMNADGTKLSKRQGHIRIKHYRENGILPLALINFIAHSGGGFAKDLEPNVKPTIFTMNELADQFLLNKVNTHPGKLMLERLPEFNRLELKRRLGDKCLEKDLIQEFRSLLKTRYANIKTGLNLQLSDDHIRYVLKWSVNRIDKLTDLFSKNLSFLWTLPENVNVDEQYIRTLNKLYDELKLQNNFNREVLKDFLKNFAAEENMQFSSLMKIVRYLLSGFEQGPAVAEMMEILGKENSLIRLENGLSNKTSEKVFNNRNIEKHDLKTEKIV